MSDKLENQNQIYYYYRYAGAVFNFIAYLLYLIVRLTIMNEFKKYKIDKKAKYSIIFYELKLFINVMNSTLIAIDFIKSNEDE